MNNKTILKKAVEKAEKNGFSFGDWIMKHISNRFPKAKGTDVISAITWTNIDLMIYSHDFAKAFWGGKDVCNHCGGSGSKCCGALRIQINRIPAWQYHLQQMVISKDPLQYLKKWL